MVTTDNILATIPDSFDLSTLLDPEVESIESAVYSRPLIYKYYAPTRRDFFERLQVRLSPRDALNDPFEMSERWKEISTEGLQTYMRSRLGDVLPKLFANTGWLVAKTKEHLAERGVVLTDAHGRHLEEFFNSEAGRELVSSKLPEAQAMTAVLTDYVFAHMEAQFQQFTDNFIGKTGVLSLTEDALSQQMWALYAASGSGFVVGLDAQHGFFKGRDGLAAKSVLRKVLYTDERTQNFWRNPYYLFLVKNADWSYEKEWRMLKDMSECDEERVVETQKLALWNLPPSLIKSVYFGYNYERANITMDVEALSRHGVMPEVFLIEVNRRLGILETLPL